LGKYEYVRKHSKGKNQGCNFTAIQFKKEYYIAAYKVSVISIKEKEVFRLQQQLKTKAF